MKRKFSSEINIREINHFGYKKSVRATVGSKHAHVEQQFQWEDNKVMKEYVMLTYNSKMCAINHLSKVMLLWWWLIWCAYSSFWTAGLNPDNMMKNVSTEDDKLVYSYNLIVDQVMLVVNPGIYENTVLHMQSSLSSFVIYFSLIRKAHINMFKHFLAQNIAVAFDVHTHIISKNGVGSKQ